MQVASWKSELAGILAEDDKRQAAADNTNTAWADLGHALGELRAWIAEVQPTSAKGRRRREELVRIFGLLEDVLEEL